MPRLHPGSVSPRIKQLKQSARTLSTRDLARAIGASESSIKRWVDEGVVKAARTAGGHRRIPRSEAVRFIRESRSSVVAPEVLGLGDVAAVRRTAPAGATDADRLSEWLAAGAAAEARGFVLSLYLRGVSVAAIVDGPMRTAMERIGDLWRHDPAGILVEHRATAVCLQALAQLRAVLPDRMDGPAAIGGAPAGDPYLLPSLAAATALVSEGYRAVNLGPDLPLASLRLAVERERPALVWVSVSVAAAPAALGGELEALAVVARAAGTPVVVGGRAFPALGLAARDGLHVGDSLAELTAFARGLLAARGV